MNEVTKNPDYIKVYVFEILRYALNDRVTVTLKNYFVFFPNT